MEFMTGVKEKETLELPELQDKSLAGPVCIRRRRYKI